MKQLRLLSILLNLFILKQPLCAQLDSIYIQSVYRTFIVHKPANYNPLISYPLVLNFHGLNSSAAGQQFYSQFDPIADTANFVVVYPNGLNNSWSLSNSTDVDFVSALVDSLKKDISLKSCLFVTGLSLGGFMAYKLVCSISNSIAAVAVVSGNMTKTLQNSCVLNKKIPVMHFHGTADAIVPYGGSNPLIPPVDSTLKWWRGKNICNFPPIMSSLPNTNVGDGCSVENYLYGNCSPVSEVSLFKVINGGHTWPGATPAPPLGNTNLDINASALIWNFFRKYCKASIPTNIFGTSSDKSSVNIYPNPAGDQLTIDCPSVKQRHVTIEISNILGHICYNRFVPDMNSIKIDVSLFVPGIYLVQISDDNEKIACQKIIITN